LVLQASGFSQPAPTITSISPIYGSTAGGTLVKINGTNFVTGAVAAFGPNNATTTNFISATQVTAITPASTLSGGEGNVGVFVTNPDNQFATSPTRFTYHDRPEITGVSPLHGLPGAQVTVNGKFFRCDPNLGPPNCGPVVMFGGVPSNISFFISASQIKAVVPQRPAGLVDVTVTNWDGIVSNTLPQGFTIAPDPSVDILTMGLDDAYPTAKYDETLMASGGKPPYTWAITSGNLPSGLTLDPGTGDITGTPAAQYGTHTVTVRATDSSTPTKLTAEKKFTFNVLFGFRTSPIPTNFFGMTISDQTNPNAWPGLSVTVGSMGKGLGTVWPFVEQNQGTYDWHIMDEYVAEAKAHNLKLYWTNANIPKWAALDPSTCSFYPGTTISACTSTVKNIANFDTFMTALVTRYKDDVDMWELWNEPDVANVYTDTVPRMVELTTHAYNIIRQIAPQATIANVAAIGEVFQQAYFNAGGTKAFDVFDIHGYPNVGTADVPEAISGFKSVNMKQLMIQLGLQDKPLWDSESSWGGASSKQDPDYRASYAARSLLLHWSAGFERFYWYSWDNTVWGQLWTTTPTPNGTLLPAGMAYKQVQGWMQGASMPAPCSTNGGTAFNAIYTCDLTRSGSYKARAVWDSTQTCGNGVCTTSSYVPDPIYTQYRDIQGNLVTITPGQTLQIGLKPILLENFTVGNGPPPGPTPPPGGSASFQFAKDLSPRLDSTQPAQSSSGPCSTASAPGSGQVPAVIGIDCEGIAGDGTWLYSDSNGAVGATQFVERANANMEVFDKASGLGVWGPAPARNVFSGFGNACDASNEGDPIIEYDKAAGRWIFMSKATHTGGADLLCIAVSTTSDALGTYHRYAFATEAGFFPDYPKLGVWPDGYYVTRDDLDPQTSAYDHSTVCAMDRSAMLIGNAALQICFSNKSSEIHSLLPADLDSAMPPPTGSPNYLLALGGAASLLTYTFHADFATPAHSTFEGPVFIGVPGFASPCPPAVHLCVPQKGTTQGLDPLADRLMYRLAYRNFGDHESLVVNHTVKSNSLSGIHWYELRVSPKGLVIYQQGTFQPDSTWRWEGSAAMDKAGNIAIGYNASSDTIHPSVRFTGRLATDTLHTMRNEQVIWSGAGSQAKPGVSDAKWGYYTSLSVDPIDGCTMWYTAEYLATTGISNWKTRIASFKFPSCH